MSNVAVTGGALLFFIKKTSPLLLHSLQHQKQQIMFGYKTYSAAHWCDKDLLYTSNL